MNKKIKKIFLFLLVVFITFLIIILYFKKESKKCYLENCHGLEIKCGFKKPEYCTMEYALGDGCRRYASCEVIKGKCQPVYKPEFERCKDCVLGCQKRNLNNPEKIFQCESDCYKNL